MSMFDSVYTDIKCPVCGEVKEHEVQFKLYVGKTYEPSLQELVIGEAMASFPPIPLAEAQGFVSFECCPAEDPFLDQRRPCWAVVRVRRGVVKEVLYPQSEDYEYAELPKSRLWPRRAAASKEWYERAYREWRTKQPPLLPGIDETSGISRVAFGVAYPLRFQVNYSAIGRRFLQTGEVMGNYVRQSPGAPWRRRDGCPL